MVTRKRGLSIIGIILLVFLISNLNGISAQNQSIQYDIHLHVFYGKGCVHCGTMLSFLEEIKDNYPTLKVHKHEVYQNNEGRELFKELSDRFNTPIEGVPTSFINDRVIVGFSNEISNTL